MDHEENYGADAEGSKQNRDALEAPVGGGPSQPIKPGDEKEADDASDADALHLTAADHHQRELARKVNRDIHLQTYCTREAGEQGKDRPNKSTFKERPL